MALKLVTAEEMRSIDAATIRDRNLPALELMERAGKAVADVIITEYNPRCVGIVTGKGNNAGDGLVVARLLAQNEIEVRLLMLTEGGNMGDAGRANFERLPENVVIVDRHELPRMGAHFDDCDIIVDAILGTGIKGAVKGSLGEAIAVINSIYKPVIAVDIPSGLDADTGMAEGACVVASHTVTIGLPKRGLILGNGAAFTGELSVVDIGFPEDLTQSGDLKLHLLQMEDATAALPFRPIDGHKGSFGSLLVIAGQPGMSGAAYLTTATALRSGCGMVYGAFPSEVAHILANRLIECVKVPVNRGSEYLSHESWDSLEPFFAKSDAIAIGPGLGTHEDTARLVDEIVCLEIPMVIDADALNCLGDKTRYLSKRPAPTIITPHPGEMGRILGISVEEVQRDRLACASKLAVEANIIVALKGFRTVVALPDGRIYVNPTGNHGMAKGGSGDVLTGLIGGLLAQGCSAEQAACAGVFLHGMAGDLAGEEIGARGMTAQNILDKVPEVLKAVES
jgi:NAD(P)H-hydrate epimerase